MEMALGIHAGGIMAKSMCADKSAQKDSREADADVSSICYGKFTL